MTSITQPKIITATISIKTPKQLAYEAENYGATNDAEALLLLKYITKKFGHLSFDKIGPIRHDEDENDGLGWMDCVMMEHSMRDGSDRSFNWDLPQHYAFRAFFDPNDQWWNWYFEEYGQYPIGVEETFTSADWNKLDLDEIDN